MHIVVTVDVQAPDDVTPEQVVDEIASNVESCGWVVVSVAQHEDGAQAPALPPLQAANESAPDVSPGQHTDRLTTRREPPQETV
jgi:hypothetical protein